MQLRHSSPERSASAAYIIIVDIAVLVVVIFMLFISIITIIIIIIIIISIIIIMLNTSKRFWGFSISMRSIPQGGVCLPKPFCLAKL